MAVPSKLLTNPAVTSSSACGMSAIFEASHRQYPGPLRLGSVWAYRDKHACRTMQMQQHYSNDFRGIRD